MVLPGVTLFETSLRAVIKGQTRRLPPTNTVGFFAGYFAKFRKNRFRGCRGQNISKIAGSKEPALHDQMQSAVGQKRPRARVYLLKFALRQVRMRLTRSRRNSLRVTFGA